MFEHPEPRNPLETNHIEVKETAEVFPTQTQAEIIFDIVLQGIQNRGQIEGDNFSNEIIGMAEALVEQSPNFDETGVSFASKICRDILPYVKGVKLKFLEIGTAGEWDGQKIIISPDLLLEIVQGEDVAFLRAVHAHEEYHEENRHLDSFKTGKTARAGVIVTIGGIDFTEDALVEGMNILDVPVPHGRESSEYREYANKLLEAVKKSKKVNSLDDLRKTINKTKDLRSIEDTPDTSS